MTRANRTRILSGMALSAILLLAGCGGQQAQTEKEPASKKEKAEAAVKAAKQAVQTTREQTNDWGLWKSVLGTLGNAQESLKSDDYDAAIESAEQAKEQAEMGRQQYEEQKQVWRQAAQEANRSDEIEFREQAWVAGSGAAAGATSQREEGETGSKQVKETGGTLMMGAEAGRNDLYEVARGDNLWNISAADSIYGDPFAWPLIYKANRDEIHDPDLIYPGQEFTIERNVQQSEVKRAVQHARTRGAWSLGEPEASDLEYLNQAD